MIGVLEEWRSASGLPRILLLHESPDWCHANVAAQLAAQLAEEFEIRSASVQSKEAVFPKECDLLVAMEPRFLDWAGRRGIRAAVRMAHITSLGSIPHDPTGKALSSTVSSAGVVSGVSPVVVEDVRKRLGRDVRLCPSGVDGSQFRLAPFPSEFIVGWAGSSKCIRPGFKGLELVRTAAEMAGVPLLIADRAMGMIPHAEMPERFYQRISALVCASEAEGTPNPVLEALACGRPAISTRVGIVPSTIIEGRSGLIVERTAKAIAEALGVVREWDLDKHAADCREAAMQWSWDAIVHYWRNAFSEALGKAIKSTKPPAPLVPPPPARKVATKKPRVLLVSDVRGHAFDQNMRDLAESLVGRFEFDFWYVAEFRKDDSPPNMEWFDCVFVPYHRWPLEKILPWDRTVGSLRSRWFTTERPAPPSPDDRRLAKRFKAFHVVTRENAAELTDCPNVVYLTNPVNMSRFPSATAERNMVVSWNGNARHGSAAFPNIKGFDDIVKPACEAAGVPLVFAEYNTSRLLTSEMPEFYGKASVALCASLYEGASNSVMEAMASGLALIATDSGNVREMQESQQYHYGHSGIVIVDRTPAAFTAALRDLKKNPVKMTEMGFLNRQEIEARWSWEVWKDRYAEFLLKGVGQ